MQTTGSWLIFHHPFPNSRARQAGIIALSRCILSYFVTVQLDLSVHSWNGRGMRDRSILHVQGLTKSYSSGNGSLTVLRDISFSLAAGSTCAVVGPSGSGKTT